MAEPIYLVGGSKGGVGKSIVAMALIDYLQNLEKDVLLIESDTSNPDVFKCYQHEVDCQTVNLDTADGWIHLVNTLGDSPQKTVVINSAARNNEGVEQFGETLDGTLEELDRRLVTLWVINTQRDSLELLKQFMGAIKNSELHVLRNLHHANEDKFELYDASKTRKSVESKGGKSLNFPKLASRVSDDLFSRRLSIRKASAELPIGNRAELRRWSKLCARTFEVLVHG